MEFIKRLPCGSKRHTYIFYSAIIPRWVSSTNLIVPTGDLLDSVVANLDDLLRMPYGCGEQNMLYFAPNVFLIDYLQRTDTYTPEVAEKAENYMLVGALGDGGAGQGGWGGGKGR